MSTRKKPEVVSESARQTVPFDATRRPGQVRIKSKPARRLRLHTLADLDARTAAASRARALVAGFVADLGKHPSTAQAQLAQRGALLAAMCEHVETQWVLGKQVDLSLYGYLVSTQRRVLTSIGLERRAKLVNGRSKIDQLITAVQEAVPE